MIFCLVSIACPLGRPGSVSTFLNLTDPEWLNSLLTLIPKAWGKAKVAATLSFIDLQAKPIVDPLLVVLDLKLYSPDIVVDGIIDLIVTVVKTYTVEKRLEKAQADALVQELFGGM